MPTSAFSGIAYANIRNTRLTEIRYAASGLPFNHSTDSGAIFLREPGKIEVKAQSVTGWRKGDYPNAYDVTISVPYLQTSIPEMKVIYRLSKALHQLRVKNQNGEYYNFIANTETQAAVNGSKLLGLKFKFIIDKDKRNCELTWQGRLTKPELDWLWDNISAAQSGATGGTSGLVTSLSADRSKFQRGNFTKILIDGVEIGVFKDAKVEMESMGIEDQWNRPINQKLMVNVEATMHQVAEADLRAALAAAEEHVAINLYCANDDIIQIDSGAVMITPEYELGDDLFQIKLVGKGEIPYNYNETTPTGIDWGDATVGTLRLFAV